MIRLLMTAALLAGGTGTAVAVAGSDAPCTAAFSAVSTAGATTEAASVCQEAQASLAVIRDAARTTDPIPGTEGFLADFEQQADGIAGWLR